MGWGGWRSQLTEDIKGWLPFFQVGVIQACIMRELAILTRVNLHALYHRMAKRPSTMPTTSINWMWPRRSRMPVLIPRLNKGEGRKEWNDNWGIKDDENDKQCGRNMGGGGG